MNHYFGWSAAIVGVGFALVQVQAVQAISKAEISKTAQSITVMIQDVQNPKIAGSGVIIKREGQTYTVLTAQHVLDSPNNFRVMVADEKQYPVVQGSIQKFPGVDLALIQFTSTESYSVAKMGDSGKSPLGTASFVAGFPATTEVRSEPSFYFTSGEIAANANRPLKDGYAIAYSNPTLPGMSGGPVLNEQGELIGIHGRGEGVAVPQNAKLREDIYVLKTEFNYAVPINTFLRMAPQVNSTLAFQKLTTPAPSTPKEDDFFLQADEKLRKRDYKGARDSFNQALRINPNYDAAYTGRGIAQYNLKDDKGAINDLSQAIRLNPNNVRAYAARGIARFGFVGEGKQGAAADLKKALSLNMDTKDDIAYENRGVLRWFLEDHEGAIADFEQAIRINPNNGDAYRNRGSVRYNHLGDKQGALADYNQAIRINPNDDGAYFERGIFYVDSGDTKNAVTNYVMALQIEPEFFGAGARLIETSGSKNFVIADYDQAIQLFPNSALVYRFRGRARFDLGDKKGAISDYDQAIRLDPNYANAYGGRGRARFDLGDKKGAISDLQKAATLFKSKGKQMEYEAMLKLLQNVRGG
jgi:tetratricopeptide (TPR) repeat protein